MSTVMVKLSLEGSQYSKVDLFKEHKLKSNNKVVKSRKQAVAIGLSEQRALARKQAGKLTTLEKRTKFH